jgi:ClpX C4-type zinc finger
MSEVSQDLEPTYAFCGGQQTRVRRLVVGLHVAICNDCFDVAREILDDQQPAPAELGLEQHGGRTLAGVYVRVAQRLLALAAGIWWNWELGQPDKRSLVAYDH